MPHGDPVALFSTLMPLEEGGNSCATESRNTARDVPDGRQKEDD
jgi:hypothetical protein